jgi:hypothetical protein
LVENHTIGVLIAECMPSASVSITTRVLDRCVDDCMFFWCTILVLQSNEKLFIILCIQISVTKLHLKIGVNKMEPTQNNFGQVNTTMDGPYGCSEGPHKFF